MENLISFKASGQLKRRINHREKLHKKPGLICTLRKGFQPIVHLLCNDDLEQTYCHKKRGEEGGFFVFDAKSSSL